MLRKQSIIFALLLATLTFATAPVMAADAGVVNINTAGAEELALLPRVGDVVAQRIVDFRGENGGFKAAEDLMLVKGIGEKTFELLEPHITLSGDTTLADKVKAPRQESAGEEG